MCEPSCERCCSRTCYIFIGIVSIFVLGYFLGSSAHHSEFCHEGRSFDGSRVQNCGNSVRLSGGAVTLGFFSGVIGLVLGFLAWLANSLKRINRCFVLLGFGVLFMFIALGLVNKQLYRRYEPTCGSGNVYCEEPGVINGCFSTGIVFLIVLAFALMWMLITRSRIINGSYQYGPNGTPMQAIPNVMMGIGGQIPDGQQPYVGMQIMNQPQGIQTQMEGQTMEIQGMPQPLMPPEQKPNQPPQQQFYPTVATY